MTVIFYIRLSSLQSDIVVSTFFPLIPPLYFNYVCLCTIVKLDHENYALGSG